MGFSAPPLSSWWRRKRKQSTPWTTSTDWPFQHFLMCTKPRPTRQSKGGKTRSHVDCPSFDRTANKPSIKVSLVSQALMRRCYPFPGPEQQQPWQDQPCDFLAIRHPQLELLIWPDPTRCGMQRYRKRHIAASQRILNTCQILQYVRTLGHGLLIAVLLLVSQK